MKTFSVAVAVAVVLTIICIQESSAVPLMPYSSRSKRSPAACRWCCGCCPNMRGCGVCCRF
ncbi:hepcidin-like [Nelusetta ayraudi]|uniref:hepcidin-like n=1 Tax=Nelusetta ayraudi TaxID=303726 RepID=UPI003F701220